MTLQITFYLSRILNKKFYDATGQPQGKIVDLLIDLNFSRPKVIALKVKTDKKVLIVDFKPFEIIKAEGQYIIKCNELVEFSQTEQLNAIYLADNVLDKQIVDINGRKLVRVNDVRLAIIPTGAYVIVVDVGIEGLLRRIGISKFLKSILNPVNITIPNKYISWNEVETVDFSNSGIRLSKPFSKLHTLHPSDLADIIEDLDKRTRTSVFASLDEEKAADVLEELETHVQVNILENLTTEKAADVLDKMPADEVADIMDELEPQKAEELLNEMENETSDDVRELLEYDNNEVGSLMSTDFVAFNKNLTAGEAIEELRIHKPESHELYSILIVDDRQRLIATLSLRDLVTADPGIKLWHIMDKQLISVFNDDKIDSLAEIISKYNLLAIPVIDNSSKVQGMVVIDDIIDDLLESRKTK